MICILPYNVFLFGRPGCGKSIVFRMIEKILAERGDNVKFERVDDFPILKDLHDGDVASLRTDRFVSTPDGGFKVIDNGIWDEMLVRLNRKALQHQEDGSILAIEFSRPDYLHALTLFDRKIMENAVVIYIDASFDCCVARNEERTKRAEEEGIDAHFVSRKEMEETYFKDDEDELLTNAPVAVFKIENDKGVTPNDIEKQVRKIIGKWQGNENIK